MRLTVLGRWSPYPAPGGACPGYLVDEGTTRLLLDCGTGTVSRLRQHCEVTDLAALVITHLHTDHMLSIYPLRDAYDWHDPDPARPPLPVYAPAGASERLSALLPTPEGQARFRATLAFRAITEQSVATVGPLALSFARTTHPVYCLAVRIESGGRALVYSSDSAPAASVEALARRANLLLCEATFPDSEVALAAMAGHMTPTQAAELAARAEVDRLLLTHFSPRSDPEEQRGAAAKVFARVEIAEENAQYTV